MYYDLILNKMKNKITKLFLALLAITLGNNVNAQEQDIKTPDYVLKATNTEFLKKFAEENAAEYEINYKRAVEIATEQGKPISGEIEGKSFALVGYDKETGGLIYRGTTNTVLLNSSMFYNNSVVGSSLQTANAKPLHAAGIIGAGMITGVWDGGAGLPNHVGFTGGRYQWKNNPNSGASQGGINHGAHVAGTVAANGNFGNGVAKGFAYGATIHAYNGINVNDIPSMTSAATATTNRIYVSNHSYGLNFGPSGLPASIFGQYNADSRSYDLLANNAPYYTIVFAAGNDRGDGFNPSKNSTGKDLLSQGGVSKNTVVVAATRGTEDFSGITGPTSVVAVGGVRPFITPYSSYGPTDDFRIKPDIAAKGGEILPNNPAQTDPVVSVGTLNLSAIAEMQGTSMAAPAVTGVFTLWQGYHNQQFSRYMRSASVRALMAHTAREAGPAAGPDFMFGWGVIDAAKGVEVMDQAINSTAIFTEIDLGDSQTFEYKFTYDGVAPLVATIAWNDPAGTVTPSSTSDLNVKKLVNDLDLRLINTDTNAEYLPWSLTQIWAITHSANNIAVRNVDNARDNIEKIEPQSAVAGNYKVVVNHKGTLQGATQNFSLVISGAGGTMEPVKNGVSVEEVALNNLNIYPNPTTSVLNINGDLNVLSGASIQIFDISGKKVKDLSLNFDANNTSVNVSDLQTGTYVLSISKNGAKQSYKFIKK